jgi:8-oxo-dGTP diphosphatase
MTDRPLNATISLRGVVFGPDGDLLLVRRASDGEWELPGGRLEPDEDTLPGLRREIAEETALDVAVDEPVHTVAWRNGDDQGRFGVYYRCTATERTVSLSAEHTAAEWTTPTTAVARLSNAQARGVERATPTALSTE